MKIVAVSDLHGLLPDDIPGCDILLIAGDICPANNHTLDYQRDWLKERFDPWLGEQPARHIVGIAGNHDWLFEDRDSIPSLAWHYLQDEYVELEGVKIYGTPWQPVFFNWAFNLTEAELDEKFSLIPEGMDIVISHGPPFGYGDVVTEGRYISGKECGSTSLLKHLERVKPALCVFGHIHSGDHATLSHPADGRDILLKNVSYVNERYQPFYEPAEFDDLF